MNGLLLAVLVAAVAPAEAKEANAEVLDADAKRIVAATPMPDDFASFWQGAIAKYDREIPAPPVCTLDAKLSDATWNVWRLAVDVPGGRKLHCFVTKEKNASAGRLPTRIQISAAGYGDWSQSPIRVAGHVAMFVTVYPFEPDPALTRKADYDALDQATKAKWNMPRYCHGGITGARDDSFFYPVILGSLRAIDWMAARDDVDPKRITYSGTSQGGGLGLAVVALSKRFRRAAIFVPALTGHYGHLAGLKDGWPTFHDLAPKTPEAQKAVARNAAYYDGVNFARLVKIPVRVVAGTDDPHCPAIAVRAAFLAAPSADKTFTLGAGMTHSVYREIYVANERWLDE